MEKNVIRRHIIQCGRCQFFLVTDIDKLDVVSFRIWYKVLQRFKNNEIIPFGFQYQDFLPHTSYYECSRCNKTVSEVSFLVPHEIKHFRCRKCRLISKTTELKLVIYDKSPSIFCIKCFKEIIESDYEQVLDVKISNISVN